MKNYIKENDIVNVNFNSVKRTLVSKAIVLHIPQKTGDSWIFENIDTGTIYYVSEGCTVTLRPQINQRYRNNSAN